MNLTSIFVVQAGLTKLGIPTLIGPATTSLGITVRSVAAFLVLDLLLYWEHRFDHAFEVGWITHRLHHSPTALNLASGWRLHPLAWIATQVVAMAPYFALFGTGKATLSFFFLGELRRAWGHSRLNTDFGWIGVVVISPLFHRRHHDVRDCECNYGVFLTCWDRLFGTYRAPDEHTLNASTGISPGSLYESQGILHNLVGDTVDFFLYFARLPGRAAAAVYRSFARSGR